MKTLALALTAGLLSSMVLHALPAQRVDAGAGANACISQEAAALFASVSPSSGQDLPPTPTPRVPTTPPSWCTSRTNNYCTYNGWNWTTRCCYATYIAPGAFCPTICE